MKNLIIKIIIFLAIVILGFFAGSFIFGQEILPPEEEIIIPFEILSLPIPTGQKILYCQFSNPLKYNGQPPSIPADNWQYAEMNCYSSTTALIQNLETGSEFFLFKNLTYGDVLILIFLFLFAVFGIVKVLMDFWIPRRVTKF